MLNFILKMLGGGMTLIAGYGLYLHGQVATLEQPYKLGIWFFCLIIGSLGLAMLFSDLKEIIS